MEVERETSLDGILMTAAILESTTGHLGSKNVVYIEEPFLNRGKYFLQR